MKQRYTFTLRVGKRKVPYDMILGVGENTFRLKENQIIECLEIDKYGRGLMLVDGIQCWMWAKSIDQCSNEVKE
jgi:hypothetical protein